MGTVNSDQQLENAPTSGDCVGSVESVDDELSIHGVEHRKNNQSRSVHGDTDDE